MSPAQTAGGPYPLLELPSPLRFMSEWGSLSVHLRGLPDASSFHGASCRVCVDSGGQLYECGQGMGFPGQILVKKTLVSRLHFDELPR